MHEAAKQHSGQAIRVVVLGTGTDVGKTHVACALVREWRRRGTSVVGLKPIASGISEEGQGDHAELARAEMFHVKHGSLAESAGWAAEEREAGAPSERASARHIETGVALFHVKHPLYRFREPISPHLAARRAGITIDVQAITEWVAGHAQTVTIIETAGGAFSPLAKHLTVLDLALHLEPAFRLLVAPDRLGVLHDVTAAVRLAAHQGAAIHGVVLSAPTVPDSSTGCNAHELGWLGIATPLATFPRAASDATATLDAARAVVTAIELHVRSPSFPGDQTAR